MVFIVLGMCGAAAAKYKQRQQIEVNDTIDSGTDQVSSGASGVTHSWRPTFAAWQVSKKQQCGQQDVARSSNRMDQEVVAPTLNHPGSCYSILPPW